MTIRKVYKNFINKYHSKVNAFIYKTKLNVCVTLCHKTEEVHNSACLPEISLCEISSF